MAGGKTLQRAAHVLATSAQGLGRRHGTRLSSTGSISLRRSSGMLQIPRAQRPRCSSSSRMHSIAQRMEIGYPPRAVRCRTFLRMNRQEKVEAIPATDNACAIKQPYRSLHPTRMALVFGSFLVIFLVVSRYLSTHCKLMHPGVLLLTQLRIYILPLIVGRMLKSNVRCTSLIDLPCMAKSEK